MKKQSKCLDFYNLKLEKGQKVIPICSDALLANIDGIVSNIEYSEYYNVWFIDISDDKGNVLLKDVNPSYYSTPERFEERENHDYIYSLSFFNEEGYCITSIPLTESTNLNHELPNDIAYITLNEKIEEKTNEGISCSFSESLGIFALIDKTEFVDANNELYLITKNTSHSLPINPDCCIKKFDSNEILFKYIRNLISSFNKSENINTANTNITSNSDIIDRENAHTIMIKKNK